MSSSIRLDLPQATPPRRHPTPPAFRCWWSLDQAGQAYLDDQPVATPSSRPRLAIVRAGRPSTPTVQLRADADGTLPYGRLEVMGMRQKAAGLARIGFVADRPGRPRR